jgi:hypothetical protein
MGGMCQGLPQPLSGRSSGISLSVLTKVLLRGTPLNLPNIRQNDWYEQIYELLAILKHFLSNFKQQDLPLFTYQFKQ